MKPIKIEKQIVDEDFFEYSNRLIQEIIILLRKAKIELDRRYDTHQRIRDLRVGLIRKGGIYVPFKDVEHKIIFDAYEVQFLDTFIELYSQMFENDKNLFKEFAIRTLAEMGFYKSQILFNITLNEKERQRYKLILVLADFAFLGLDHQARISEFKKLLQEQQELLTENQRKLFIEMEKCLDRKDKEEHRRLVKKIRKLGESIQDGLHNRTTTPPIFNELTIQTFLSAYSHLLHGNIILLSELFSPRRSPNRLRLRITWLLLMVGMNTSIFVSNFLESSDLINRTKELENKFRIVSQNIVRSWRKIESGQ